MLCSFVVMMSLEHLNLTFSNAVTNLLFIFNCQSNKRLSRKKGSKLKSRVLLTFSEVLVIWTLWCDNFVQIVFEGNSTHVFVIFLRRF